MSIKTVIYIGKEFTVSELFKKSLQEKNKLFHEFDYQIVYETTVLKQGIKKIKKTIPDVVILDDTVEATDLLKSIEEILLYNSQSKLVLALTMSHYNLKKEIQKLQTDYPLAVLDVLFKPIQPADLWAFLEEVEKSQKQLTWEDGDFDEF